MEEAGIENPIPSTSCGVNGKGVCVCGSDGHGSYSFAPIEHVTFETLDLVKCLAGWAWKRNH